MTRTTRPPEAPPALGVVEAVSAAQSPVAALADLDVNAAMEGADVVSANVPTSYSTLFDRVDEFLRARGRALVARAHPRTNSMQPVAFDVFKVDLDPAKQIDIVAEAKELGLLEPFESPLPYWPSQPRG
jgi:hypothetical protein